MPREWDDLHQVEKALLARSFLFDNPNNYRAGVTATIRAVRRGATHETRDPESPYASMIRGTRLGIARRRPAVKITDREMKLLSMVC